MLTDIKFAMYAVMIACFTGAGVIDLYTKQWKLGVIALLLAVINGLLFFWR